MPGGMSVVVLAGDDERPKSQTKGWATRFSRPGRGRWRVGYVGGCICQGRRGNANHPDWARPLKEQQTRDLGVGQGVRERLYRRVPLHWDGFLLMFVGGRFWLLPLLTPSDSRKSRFSFVKRRDDCFFLVGRKERDF